MVVNEAGIELLSNRYYPAGKEIKFTIGPYLNDETTFLWGELHKNNPFESFKLSSKEGIDEVFVKSFRRHFIFKHKFTDEVNKT